MEIRVGRKKCCQGKLRIWIIIAARKMLQKRRGKRKERGEIAGVFLFLIVSYTKDDSLC